MHDANFVPRSHRGRLVVRTVLTSQYLARSQHHISLHVAPHYLIFSPSGYDVWFRCHQDIKARIYFMYTIKWSVMQYVIISSPLCIIGIITQALGVLCVQIYTPHFAEMYIVAIDFVSISVALYGLILFYNLTRTELVGRRPLAKFLCIKGIVMLTFYQEFVFSVPQKYKVIHATEFWTATSVANGLNALATTIEMVFFAAFMLWAYPVSEYKDDSLPKTSIWRPLWDIINYADFGHEIFGSVAFFVRYLLGRPNTHTPKGNSYPAQFSYQGVQIPRTSTSRIDFGDAFGLWNTENNGGKKKKASTHKNSSSYDEESQAVLAPEYDAREDGDEIGGDIPMWDFKDGK
ncbi:hypothetical protein M422DRAFT_259258 [Sphaerobolus stellatus SS14]|uniref:Uncharacterized protein n=1 Tax=Sphaerobolus stellatus (strain SS14) TaxID=990650 RepID=A0A0C9V973_SPHS4|nr:hypothetical protein M422DRAFT_259258 [Sphaerobolus stellatus SS14]